VSEYNNNGHPGNIDKRWVLAGLLLLVPGLRFIGIIWMLNLYSKSKRGESKDKRKLGFWGFLALLMVLCNIGEITGALSGLILPLTGVAACGLGAAYFFKKSDDRQHDYISYIGDCPAISLDDIASTMGVPRKLVEFDIRRMKKKKLLPETAYIDKARNMLVLTPEGRQAPETKKQEETRAAFEESNYTKILRQIRALNDEIADPVVSEKIYRIETTTASIFKIVEEKPERVTEIQTFLEYYLPTTLKLLASYAQLERTIDGGENIRASKASIESIMDKLVSGFDEQLDRLYKSDAIDITSDVKTLEKMMRMEGLGSH